MGSAPTAAAANAVPEDERAGALALLRVCGDLGLLTGSAGFGALAAAAGSSSGTAFAAAAVGAEPRTHEPNPCTAIATATNS